MKQSSIQTKVLTLSVVLVLITIVGISVAYYVLIRQDKRREFKQRLQVTFDLILDDYEARLTNLSNRVKHFSAEDFLITTTTRYMEDEERIRSIAFVTANLVKTAGELRRFAQVNSAQTVLLYGADKRLIAAHVSQDSQEFTGMSVQDFEGTDRYLPLEDASQVTALLPGHTPFPDISLPERIRPLYRAEYPAGFPETLASAMFTEDAKIGMRIMAPILLQQEMTGFLIVEVCYTQASVERYASLSQTGVSFFVGTQFSVGTFSEYPTPASTELVSCDALRQRPEDLEIFPVTFNEQRYYQGQCVFSPAGQQPPVIIVIRLSKAIENLAVQQIVTAALYAVAIVFTITLGLSWFFSRRISRPIRMIAHQIHRISDGDLTDIEIVNPQHQQDRPHPGGEASQHRLPVPPQNSAKSPQKPLIASDEDEIALLTHSFYAMAEYLQSMAVMAQKISLGDIAQTIAPRSDKDTLGLAFQQMLAYIRGITGIVRDLSDGNLLVDAQPRSEQDILNHSLRKMLIYIQGVANVAESIADGNLQVRVEPKSELDVLNQSLQRMVSYIQDVADITERIARNDMQVLVSPRSDHDVLNISLYKMVLNLQTAREKAEHSMAEVEQQNWLKTGQAELNDIMRGEQHLSMLAKHIITYLADYLQAQVGLLYISEERDGEPILQLAGSYAYTSRQGHRNLFRFGEGLVGQAALEQEPLLFADIPDGYITVVSGLGEITPQSIFVVPFLYEGEVKGVIELGTLYEFTALQREFLILACESIAIAIHTAQSRVRMQHLLTETQQQSEALQVQQEELRQSNAELEARTHALQESEAKLQAQQEELRQSNVQLQAQAEALKVSEEKLQAQQEELRQTNEELEANTRQLEQQQQVLKENNRALEQSRELLAEKAHELELTNRYKSEFLANMSHELRTPLNSVLILSKLLHENKEGNLTDKQKKSAHMIYQAVTNWIDLIDDILDLSELETGKMAAHYEVVHLKAVSTFIEQHFGKTCQEKGLEFRIEFADNLPAAIRTDRKRLEQILKNLVSNALKFTDHGQVHISLARPADDIEFSQSRLSREHTVAIRVYDSGIGISKDQMAVIFEAFHQADGSTTRQHGGTGLGLSISQKLAALLGGEIRVQSEVGEGSTFTLYLPEQPVAEPSGNRTIPIESTLSTVPSPESSSPKKTRTILVADEDDESRTQIEAYLQHDSFRILPARTGQEACRILQTRAIDGLIADLDLPDMPVLLEYLKRTPTALIIYTDRVLTRKEEIDLRAYTEHIILKEGQTARERLLDALNVLQVASESDSIRAKTSNARLYEEDNPVLQGKTILLVDDDVRNLYALTNALEEYGMTILMGVNGKGALEQLAEHPEIALVVMDIMMPEMDGYEAIREIRKQDAFRDLPVIALTARAMKQEHEKCREIGANEYLTKPVDIEKLVSLLRLWLTTEDVMHDA